MTCEQGLLRLLWGGGGGGGAKLECYGTGNAPIKSNLSEFVPEKKILADANNNREVAMIETII